MFSIAYVYAVLAFAETLVLFASVLGLLVLALRQVVRGIDSLIDAAINSSSPDTKPRVRTPSRFNVAAESRLHRIPGGHNERF